MSVQSSDYVVVGGGTAGCVLAARLAETSGTLVTLIEAGPTDVGVGAVEDLARWHRAVDSRFDWGYRQEEQRHFKEDCPAPAGRVLGGSNATHCGTAFLRPPASDFEDWAREGGDSWGPTGVYPFFERLDQMLRTETEAGLGSEAAAAAMSAARQAGYKELLFPEDTGGVGVGWFTLMKAGARRISVADAYLRQASPASGLDIRTDTVAHKILFDDECRAVGVLTDQGTITATREVIICAGPYNTPQLLMLSGIGPGEHLVEHGLTVVRDAPGVGGHLLDQPEGILNFETHAVPGSTRQHRPLGIYDRTGADPDEKSPDLLLAFSMRGLLERTQALGYPTPKDRNAAIAIVPTVVRARSEGTVRLSTADPEDPPLIDHNYLDDAYDQSVMLEGLKRARKWAQSDAWQALTVRELAPGPHAETPDEWMSYVGHTGRSAGSACGSCCLGTEETSVVDPELRVRGVRSLRVVDASALPRLVSVDPATTIMMLAEKAADLIRRR